MIDFKSESVRNLLLAAIDSKGYKEEAKKTSKRHRVFKDGSGDTVIVSQSCHFQLYYNPGNSDDKGDVIRFLLNRAGSGVNCNNSLNVYYKQIENELKTLGNHNFTNNHISVEDQPFNWEQYRSFVSKFGESIPTNIQALLNYRCIDLSAVLDPSLQPILQYRYGNSGYSNIFFPFRDMHGSVVGGQYKYLKQNGKNYETVKMILPNSERERSLWYTDGTGKDSLFIVEDPLDAIAFQLMYHHNFQYVATSGSITSNQIVQIQKMAAQKRLILGNDLDFAGLFANLSIIEGKPVSKTINKDGTAIFRIDGEETYSFDLSTLKEFVKERAKKANIHVLFPVFDDWNEELKQKRKPTPKLVDATINTTSHTNAGQIAQRTGLRKHI